MASARFLFFLTLITAVTSHDKARFNQTQFQAAMADIRSQSYHGFFILLNLIEAKSIPLKNGDVTFLVPDDRGLSEATIGLDHVHDFILSHMIPASLGFDFLVHLPTGTLLPTSVPTRKLSFSNYGKSGLVVNNARVVRPNMCNTSNMIKCHGISAALTF